MSEPSMSILIVEDDADVLAMMQLALNRDLPNARRTEVDEAHVALGIAKEEAPDVVVLDSGVAGMTTEDLVEQLRRVSPSSRVVLYSAIDRATLEQKAKTLGVPAFRKEQLSDLISYVVSLQ